MTARREPLVVLLYSVPLLVEALKQPLAEVGEVRAFQADDDVAGLLRWLEPDALVVDSDENARRAAAWAREAAVPLVHVVLSSGRIRILASGEWRELDERDDSPETIRNVIAGHLFRGVAG